MRMLCVILSIAACLAVPHFYTLMVHFSEQMLFNMKCVFLFSVQLLSETFLILIRTGRNITVHVHRSLFNLLAPEFFFLILAQPVYKM